MTSVMTLWTEQWCALRWFVNPNSGLKTNLSRLSQSLVSGKDRSKTWNDSIYVEHMFHCECVGWRYGRGFLRPFCSLRTLPCWSLTWVTRSFVCRRRLMPCTMSTTRAAERQTSRNLSPKRSLVRLYWRGVYIGGSWGIDVLSTISCLKKPDHNVT